MISFKGLPLKKNAKKGYISKALYTFIKDYPRLLKEYEEAWETLKNRLCNAP
jgi:hypothetical protein